MEIKKPALTLPMNQRKKIIMKIKFQNKNYKNAENQYLCDIAK